MSVTGTVTHDLDDDRFVVETPLGYTLLEWYGGSVIAYEGDTVVGDLHSYGMKDVQVIGRSPVRVWVEDFFVSKEEADKFWNKK